MKLQRSFFIVLVLPMLLSVPLAAQAGNYDTEMKNMAAAISASFENRQVKSIAVLDFTDLQGTISELGRFLAEELSSNLVTGNRQFDVIDRANLNRILDEHKFSRSGLVDPENIKRLGKIAGVDALVTGTVTPLGNTLRVTTKVISTETAKIVGSSRGDVEKTPEISELLRNRVVDVSVAPAAKVNTQISDKAAPAKKAKLIHESKSFRAAVDTVSFDKSSNQMTVFIDITNLDKDNKLCIAASGDNPVLAIDAFSNQWKLVRMVSLQKGLTQMDAPKENNQWEEFKRKVEDSYLKARPEDSQRFALVLAPAKADSSLTIDLTLELLLSFRSNFSNDLCGLTSQPERLSIGFKGITPTQQ